MIKVSVIVPIFGEAEHLGECLQSLRCQTLKDMEIICVYCSSDHSRYYDIFEQYMSEDDRVSVIEIPEADGGKALNDGIESALGEYTGFMLPDDYAALDLYENYYRAAEENEAEFVRADFYRVRNEKSGDVLQICCRLSDNPEDYNRVFASAEDDHALCFLPEICSGIYRKDFLREFDVRFNERAGESVRNEAFFFQTSVFGKRAMLLDKAGYYRREGSADGKIDDPQKVYAADIEYDFIRDVLMERPDVWKKVTHIYWKKRFVDSLAVLDTVAPEYKKEFCRNMSREFNAAKKAGMIRYEDYGEKYWLQMLMILKDPETFAASAMGLVEIPKVQEDYVVDITKLKSDSRRLQDVLNSNSYKLGFALTKLPRKAKEYLKKYLK